MQDRKLQYSVNRTVTGKHPPGTPHTEFAMFHRNWQITETAAIELLRNIYRGYSFAPVWQGRKQSESMRRVDYLAFDLDEQGLDEIAANQFCQFFATFAYSTPSSTPEAPRSRVLFLLDEPITDHVTFARFHEAIAWRLNSDGLKTDPACKDILRFFYGSPRCETWQNWSMLEQGGVEMIARELDELKAKAPKPAAKPVNIAAANDLSAAFLRAALDRRLQAVREAPDGSRHAARAKISYLLGGYVAAGYYPMTDVIAALDDAAAANTDNLAGAKRTIRDCVAAGMAAPLYFEAVEKAASVSQPTSRRMTSGGVTADFAARLAARKTAP
jgi:hypothetical protein